MLWEWLQNQSFTSLNARHVFPHRPFTQRPPARGPVPGRGGAAAAVGAPGAGQTPACGTRSATWGRPQFAAAFGFIAQPTRRAAARAGRQSQHFAAGA